MLTEKQRHALESAIKLSEYYLVGDETAQILREMLAASPAPAEGREAKIASLYASGGTTGFSDFLMSDGSVKTLKVEDIQPRDWLRPAALATAPTMSEAARDVLWRHKKTGGVYSFVAESRMERDPKAVVVTYRNINTGETWTRPYGEFYDGRFERIDRAAAKENKS